MSAFLEGVHSEELMIQKSILYIKFWIGVLLCTVQTMGC